MSRLPNSGRGVQGTPGMSAHFPIVAVRTVAALIEVMVCASASA
jgi:hypothetical protein